MYGSGQLRMLLDQMARIISSRDGPQKDRGVNRKHLDRFRRISAEGSLALLIQSG